MPFRRQCLYPRRIFKQLRSLKLLTLLPFLILNRQPEAVLANHQGLDLLLALHNLDQVPPLDLLSQDPVLLPLQQALHLNQDRAEEAVATSALKADTNIKTLFFDVELKI